jgi:hypothetical protein
MFKSFTGYSSCKDTFKDAIQTSIIGITNHFVSVVFNPKVANRYKLKMQSATYYWMDEHNGAVVKAHIQLEATRDKSILFIDVEDTPGLPCMFAIRFDPSERFPLDSYEIYHKGATPSNAIIQGIYGRLVDHTDALDYKDLDYV